MTNTSTRVLAPKANQKVPWKAEQPKEGMLFAAAAQKPIHDELQIELQKKNFVRAAAIAASLGLSANELRDIQYEALWQIAVNRNAPGTRRLARQYGISRQTLKQILEERAKQLREDGHDKALAACYDAATGKYLAFEEWTNHLIERWDN